jgi:hypothetical protein
MGTRRYEYNQIRVRIHIIMGSQISVYYTRGYPFSHPPYARDGFYTRVPMGMGIFATPIEALISAGTLIDVGAYLAAYSFGRL